MLKIFAHFIGRTRTFRVYILSLFLSLFVLSFACIVTFTYSENYKSILSFSKVVAKESIHTILSKFQSIVLPAEWNVQTLADFLPTMGPVTESNPILVSYLLNILKYDPHFSNMFVGLPDGSAIGTMSLAFTSHKNFLSDSSQPLPKDATFVLRLVDQTQHPSVETWNYLNDSFELLASEKIIPASINATRQPWYEGVTRTKKLFWTGVYTFGPSLQKGISVATPVLDSQNTILAVVGANLSFTQFSDFLSKQKVGKQGKAFLFDSQGDSIITDTNPFSALSKIAYNQFKAHPESPHFILDYKGVKYLSFVTKLPYIFGTDWMIVVVSPLEDFLGAITRIQNLIFLFFAAILVIVTCVIIYFSKKLSSPISTLSTEIEKISKFDLSSKKRIDSTVNEISLLDGAINTMRHVVQSFARYIPKEVVKKLCQNRQEIVLGGEKKEITIFSSDVSNFTSITESQPIDVLLPLLREYFDVMAKILLSQKGTIDKFIGDGIMAFWGAPLYEEDHASRACDAALLCQAELRNFNQKRKKENKPEFFTRFGIHTGTVIVGNIGTRDRMNYTIIGDAVNITVCLQEVDKTYHTSILISEETYHNLGPSYIARPLDTVLVKGKVKTVKIYELLGKLNAEPYIAPTSEEITLCQLFAKAYEAMQQGQLLEAKGLFLFIANQFPDDFPTQIQLKRITEMLKKTPT